MEKQIVLVVDDEEMIEEMIESFLTKIGYRTISFTDPDDALDFFQKRPDLIDLVITDLKMPGMTGEELARRVLAVDGQTPVILVTGFLVNPVDGLPNIRKVLVKPVLKKDLIGAVEETIGPPAAQKTAVP